MHTATVDLLRTPESCFDTVTDFPYEPLYAEVPDLDGGTLRMAYYVAGPADGPVVLLLHGEPTWSYLYRTVMAQLTEAGLRSMAVDLVGFGRSDKPSHIEDHTYARHVEWMRSLLFDVLDLQQVTLVGQDWGGLIGLRLVAEHTDRFARVVAANTGLPTGDHDMPAPWWKFREAMVSAPAIHVSRFVAAGCLRPLQAATANAYNAPFPEPSFHAGPRVMPTLVPTRPDDPASEANRAVWAVLTTWERPFLIAFSDGDPITGAMAPILKSSIPGAKGLDHPVIEGAGHFLQEDAGLRLGQVVAEFVGST